MPIMPKDPFKEASLLCSISRVSKDGMGRWGRAGLRSVGLLLISVASVGSLDCEHDWIE
jgi:hypothetical protein